MAMCMTVQKRFIIVSNTEATAFDADMRQQVKGNPDVQYVLMSDKYRKRRTAGGILDSDAAVADLEAF